MTTTTRTTAVNAPLLELYLNDHLAGATAGRSRAHRMASAHADLEMGPELKSFADELDAEHHRVRELLSELGLSRRVSRQVLARVAEEMGRLKMNGHWLRRSPMTPVLELELMRGAVNAKVGMWELLATLSEDLGLDRQEFVHLGERVDVQSALLARLHEEIAGPAFERGPAPN